MDTNTRRPSVCRPPSLQLERDPDPLPGGSWTLDSVPRKPPPRGPSLSPTPPLQPRGRGWGSSFLPPGLAPAVRAPAAACPACLGERGSFSPRSPSALLTCMMVLRIFHSRYVSSSSSMAAAACTHCACAEPRSGPLTSPSPCRAVASECLNEATFGSGSAKGSPSLTKATVGCARSVRPAPPPAPRKFSRGFDRKAPREL